MTSVALCGIDGAGKSTLAARLRATLVSRGHRPVTVSKNDRHEARALAATRFRYEQPAAFLDGLSATWHALTAALDFLQYVHHLTSTRLLDGHVLLLDRYVDCYVAFAATVDPECKALVEALLENVPPADLVVHVRVPPTVAWSRITKDPHRVLASDESPALLERFDAAFHELFRGRSDVIEIDNTRPLDVTVRTVTDHIEGYLRRDRV
ncbi:MAG: hypothetical protein WBD40_12805 [Tepidisphaeraceae bacterium]